MFVCARVHVYVCVCVVCVCVCVCTYICMCRYVSVCAHTFVCVYVCDHLININRNMATPIVCMILNVYTVGQLTFEDTKFGGFCRFSEPQRYLSLKLKIALFYCLLFPHP